MTDKLRKLFINKTIVFFTGTLFFSNCAGGIIKPGRMTNIVKYSYEYESEQLISHTEKSLTKLFGITIDSYLEKTNYLYNENGLLIKKIINNDFQNKPTIEFFDYNKNDSLILELRINNEGDTIIWTEYNYYPDGRKTIFHREIWPKMDFTSLNRQNDTTLFRYEYEYADNKCTTKNQYDKENNIISSIDYEYSDNRLDKEIHYKYLNSKKVLDKTKFYDYSKMINTPDYYTIDSKNDTVQRRINQFKKESAIYTIEKLNSDDMEHITYLKNGIEIKTIGTNKKMNNKAIHTYKYYKNGDLKRMKTK